MARCGGGLGRDHAAEAFPGRVAGPGSADRASARCPCVAAMAGSVGCCDAACLPRRRLAHGCVHAGWARLHRRHGILGADHADARRGCRRRSSVGGRGPAPRDHCPRIGGGAAPHRADARLHADDADVRLPRADPRPVRAGAGCQRRGQRHLCHSSNGPRHRSRALSRAGRHPGRGAHVRIDGLADDDLGQAADQLADSVARREPGGDGRPQHGRDSGDSRRVTGHRLGRLQRHEEGAVRGKHPVGPGHCTARHDPRPHYEGICGNAGARAVSPLAPTDRFRARDRGGRPARGGGADGAAAQELSGRLGGESGARPQCGRGLAHRHVLSGNAGDQGLDRILSAAAPADWLRPGCAPSDLGVRPERARHRHLCRGQRGSGRAVRMVRRLAPRRGDGVRGYALLLRHDGPALVGHRAAGRRACGTGRRMAAGAARGRRARVCGAGRHLGADNDHRSAVRRRRAGGVPARHDRWGSPPG